MAYFESEIVQIAVLAASGGLLLGLLLGYLWGRADGRRRARPPAHAAPPAPVAAPPPGAGTGVPLSALPGMSDAVAAKLAAAGVADVGALWAHGQDEDTLHGLCDAVQLEDFALRRWIAIADLCRVDGIEPQTADALVRTGVRSAADLAEANPDRVQNRLAKLAEEGGALEAAPARAAVADWIDRAASV